MKTTQNEKENIRAAKLRQAAEWLGAQPSHNGDGYVYHCDRENYYKKISEKRLLQAYSFYLRNGYHPTF